MKNLLFSWMVNCTNSTQGEDNQIWDNYFDISSSTRAYETALLKRCSGLKSVQQEGKKDIWATESKPPLPFLAAALHIMTS